MPKTRRVTATPKSGSKQNANYSQLNFSGEKLKSPWEQDIGNVNVTDDLDFTCYISFFIESSAKYYGLMEMFTEAAEKGKRWEIKVISKEYIKKTVLDYCTKSREKKPFNLLCDQILRYAGYDFEGRIPPSLLGYFIKYEIRRLKNAYEDHIDYNKKYEEARETRVKAVTKLLDSTGKISSGRTGYEDVQDVKGKPKSGNKSKEAFPKQINKNKLPKFQINYGKRRPESELTIRSEEKRGMRYANDFPKEGPQVYLVITTIYEQLPSELLEIMKIPVVCIVKVGEENIKKAETKEFNSEDFSVLLTKGTREKPERIEDQMNTDSWSSDVKIVQENLDQIKQKNKLINVEYENRLLEINKYYYELRAVNKKKFEWQKSHTNKEIEVQRFWSGFNKKVRQPNNSHYEETILSKYEPPLEAIDYNKVDWKEQLKDILYDEITFSLFNQCQISVLYNTYTSTKGGHILKPDKLEEPVGMAAYNNELKNIPNECINIPLIFDSMISQVEEYFNEEQYKNKSMDKNDYKSISQINDRQLALQNKLTKLNQAYDIKTQRRECEELPQIKSETMFFSNKVQRGSKHIGKLLKEKTINPIKVMYSNVFKEIRVPTKVREKYKKHLIMFQNALGIRQRKKLGEILIIMRSIESIHKVMVHDILTHKDEETEICDDYGCPDFSDKYLIENELQILKNDKKVFSKTCLNTIEELDPDSLMQTIFDLTLTHNTLQVTYIPLLDSLLYKFYNCPKNKFRTAVMQTPINLRDFLKYSLPIEKEWAQKVLDDLYKESIPKTYETKLDLLREKIENPFIDAVEITPKLFIDNNSFLLFDDDDDDIEDRTALKYLRDINYTDTFFSQPSHFESKEYKKKAIRSLSNLTGMFSGLNITSDKFKNTQFNNRKASTELNDYSAFYKEKKTNGQIYDLGPCPRVQFNYRSIYVLFRHGTIIRIQYRHKLYGRRTINLELHICNHRLYYNSNIYINSEQSRLLFIHRSGIIMSFKEFQREQVYRERFNDKTASSIGTEEELEDCQINPSPNSKKNLESFYILTVTWPNGCILETKCLDEDNFYIKQYYLSKCPISDLLDKEKYRIFLKDNSLVKLLNDNIIEILYATGKKITCYDYEWETDNQEINPENEQNKFIKMKQFTTIHPSGKVYTVNQYGHEIYEGTMTIQETVDFSHDHRLIEMENGTTIIVKNDGTQIVKFNDCTRFITEIRAINGDEIMNENEEKINEASAKLDNSSTNSSNDWSSASAINYGEYIVILMYTTMEHPNFTTIGFCPQSQTLTLKLPKNIAIDIHSDRTYNIKLSEGANLSVGKDRIIFDKYRNRKLFQRSIIMPNVLKYDIIPDPPIIHFLSSDIYGNELKINTQSEIYYRYALSEENPFCLKNVVNDPHYVVVKRDLSGMEIFPQHKLETMKSIIKKTRGSTIQNYWNGPFKETIMIHPGESKIEEWQGPLVTKYSNEKFELPTTFGDSWIYPFKIQQEKEIKNSKILLIRSMKTLIINNVYNVINKTLKTYQNMIDNKIEFKNCKCKKIRFWDMINNKKCIKKVGAQLFKKGNVLIKHPTSEFMSYLKGNILIHALQLAKSENSRPIEDKKFREKRSSIFKKTIPTYFTSPFGMAYFVTTELKDRINQTIESQEYNSALGILLYKDLKTVTYDDIDDISNLLVILKSGTFGDEATLTNILVAGRELEDSFKNMWEVIKYHLGVRKRRNPAIEE